MAGVTSLSRVQAYAETGEEEALDVSDAEEAEDVTTEEIDTGSPGETETEGENPPDAAEEPAEPEAVSEETADTTEETPADETVTVEETAEEPAPAKAEAPMLKAATKAEKTGTVLAFTSDVHNCFKGSSWGSPDRTEDDISAARIGKWIDKVESIHGDIDVMAFGGDMANASASATDFWTLTQNDLDVLSEKGVTGVLTTGNHEHSPGKYSASSTNATQQVYKISKEGAAGDNYRIYCLGSESSSSTYSTSQISKLTSYLNGAGNDKPIFIITHFPLHNYGSRTTTGASNVISALNDAVDNNAVLMCERKCR